MDGLCDDALLLIAQFVLDRDGLSGLRFATQTSASLRERLSPLRQQIDKAFHIHFRPVRACHFSRLRITHKKILGPPREQELTSGYKISPDGESISGGAYSSWAAGSLLPAAHRCNVHWTFTIDSCWQNAGALVVGVCDESATAAWGLQLRTCEMWRKTRGVQPGVTRDAGLHAHPVREMFACERVPPPPGFPDVPEARGRSRSPIQSRRLREMGASWCATSCRRGRGLCATDGLTDRRRRAQGPQQQPVGTGGLTD